MEVPVIIEIRTNAVIDEEEFRLEAGLESDEEPDIQYILDGIHDAVKTILGDAGDGSISFQSNDLDVNVTVDD